MIADLVVHLTGSKEDDVRLAYAEHIARTFNAHLTGLQVHRLPELIATTEPAGSAFLQELLAQSHERAQATTDALKEKFAAFSVSAEVRCIDAYRGTVGNQLATYARTADLFIGTRPYGDPGREDFIEEQVLFGSGHGCLFVSPGGTPPSSYSVILVAWKETEEAARAVSEALPFLKQADEVIVALFEEGASEQFRIEAGADIGRHLSRHGVATEIRKIGGWANTGEAILNEAKRIGADMIVMGGYGHSRFREWVLGGATRHVLANATVPVLMAH